MHVEANSRFTTAELPESLSNVTRRIFQPVAQTRGNR